MKPTTIYQLAFIVVTVSLPTFGLSTQSTLKILHYSSSELSLSTSSSAIIGEQEVFVIDPGFTNSAAKDMISLIKQFTNLPVTKIFATHEHPDHYFGATELMKAYPNASLLATPQVVLKIKQQVKEKVDQWIHVFGPNEIPSSPRLAEPFSEEKVTLKGNENEPIELLQPLQGDVADATAYWIPSQKVLITGDLVYSSKIHVWLAEAIEPESRENWLRSLEYLSGLEASRVIGGHVPSNEEPSVSDIAATKEYIQYFHDHILGNDYSAQEIFARMKERYPDRTGLTILNQTAIAYDSAVST